MSAPGCTSGDWTVFGKLGDWCGIEGGKNRRSIVIWAVPKAEGDDGGVRDATPEEAFANAHQIAASGKLYDALERELADLNEDIRWAEASDLDRLVARRDRMETALASARGESQ